MANRRTYDFGGVSPGTDPQWYRRRPSEVAAMRALDIRGEDDARHKVFLTMLPYRIVTGILTIISICGLSVMLAYFVKTSSEEAAQSALADRYVSIEQDAHGTPKEQPEPGDGKEMPSDGASASPNVDFSGLMEKNPETAGWLYIPGTTVNYPVMFSPERNKYLRLDFDGQTWSLNGCLFFDWECDPDIDSNRHMIIYGHHMDVPVMFHDVSLYESEPGFLDRHRTMWLMTPKRAYKLLVVGVQVTAPDNVEARRTKFADGADFQGYLDRQLSSCDKERRDDFDRKSVDRLVTLVTCARSGTARSLVQCVVIGS